MDFADFYRLRKDPVLRAVFAATADRGLAEEAVSEAFARACAQWRKVERHPNPVGWVTKTALNYSRSSYRMRARTRPGSIPERGYEQPGPVDPDLVSAVLSLPGRQREVVALRVLLDLSTEDTAAVLGIAEGTVTAHLHRALTTLRRELVEEVSEHEA